MSFYKHPGIEVTSQACLFCLTNDYNPKKLTQKTTNSAIREAGTSKCGPF